VPHALVPWQQDCSVLAGGRKAMSRALSESHEMAEAAPASPTILLDIAASVRLAAEPCRVLYALSIPEYMEAWMQFPEMDRVECHSDKRSFDRFRIDLFRSGARWQRIYGSCRLNKPNRITYLWGRDHCGDRVMSLVELHLWDKSSHCNLMLRHTGFRNSDERERFSRMWSPSLKRLSRLLERT
jgi:uncharacterized protein YndB with AHSA1/START domain